MSYQDFQKAMELAPKCRYYHSRGGTTADKIQKAEELLGVCFSKQCREFYEKYNYISFYGQEIYGIDPDKLDVFVGNSVGYTLSEREEWGLPEKWVLFLDNGADGMAVYMDYSQLNAEGEPRIIEAFYTDGEHLDEFEDDDFEDGQEPEGFCRYMISEVLAEDFGAFLLKLVEEELAAQKEEPVQEASTTKKDPYDFSGYTFEQIQAKLKEIDESLDEIERKIDEENERRSKVPWLAKLFKKQD